MDRVRLGYVVDFLDFHYYTQYFFPAFNIADFAISVGVVILLIATFVVRPTAVAAALIFFLGSATPAHAKPERIVTLTPVVAEWVSEILGPKTQTRLVGVSEFSVYPNELKKLKSIGPYPQIQIEAVAKLKPDLVIALEGSNRSDQIEKLKRLQLNVQTLPPESIDRMGDWIEKLGTLLEEPEAAKRVRQQWEFELKSLEPLSPRTVFFQVQGKPLITVGEGSFLTQAFERIGAKNAFSDLSQAYPKVSREAVLKVNPDEIWILDLNGQSREFESSQKDWEQFQTLNAVRNQKIKVLRGDDFARCSLRLLKALKSLK
jgi:ABC-type Fe3+-hydroxamate transport system substrate-binding protein